MRIATKLIIYTTVLTVFMFSPNFSYAADFDCRCPRVGETIATSPDDGIDGNRATIIEVIDHCTKTPSSINACTQDGICLLNVTYEVYGQQVYGTTATSCRAVAPSSFGSSFDFGSALSNY